MHIDNARDLARAFRYGPYAWPGGYPVYLVLTDGEALCWECFRDNYRHILDEVRGECSGSGWKPAGMDINYEDADATCGHCGEALECAYPPEPGEEE